MHILNRHRKGTYIVLSLFMLLGCICVAFVSPLGLWLIAVSLSALIMVRTVAGYRSGTESEKR